MSQQRQRDKPVICEKHIGIRIAHSQGGDASQLRRTVAINSFFIFNRPLGSIQELATGRVHIGRAQISQPQNDPKPQVNADLFRNLTKGQRTFPSIFPRI